MTHATAAEAIAASRANGGAPEWCESTPENYAHLRDVARDVFASVTRTTVYNGGEKVGGYLSYYGRLDPKTGFE